MNLFAFHRGSSLFHGLDVRAKCFLVCVFSITIINARATANLILLILLFIFLIRIGIRPVHILKHLKLFLLFLGLICFSRWATLPGQTMYTPLGLTLTWEGLTQGLMVSLRFFNIMLLGLMFTVTTKSWAIKAAAQWFLKPIPFVPEKRMAVIMGLSLRFIPLILTRSTQVSDAVNARCGHLRKNPVKRLINISWPLLRQTFASADHLAMAMEARCYTEDRTEPDFEKNGKERPVVIAAIALSTAMIILNWM